MEVEGESEWVMKVTDKWVQSERMLFGRRADTAGGGDDRQMQGEKRKSMLVGRTKSNMNILRGSAQPKKSESLN